MIDTSALIVAMLYTSTATCLLAVGLPQAWAFATRGWRLGDLQAFRLKTTMLCCGFAGLLLWRAAVMLDFAAFGQRFLGTIGQRSEVEVILALVLQAGAGYTLVLYWRTRHHRHDPETGR